MSLLVGVCAIFGPRAPALARAGSNLLVAGAGRARVSFGGTLADHVSLTHHDVRHLFEDRTTSAGVDVLL